MVTYAPVLVEAPVVDPLPYGLLNAAILVDDTDQRFGMGVQYEADYCGEATDTAGVCEDLGTLTGAVDASRHLTLDSTGAPDGGYFVLWGDETGGAEPAKVATIDGAGHTYAAAGDYAVVITGPRSYRATLTVHVNTAATSGPFTATVGVSKTITEGIDIVGGTAFAVMHLFRCASLGEQSDGAARARRSLQMGESRAVERVVARQIARDENTVIVTADTQHVVDGLAMLEKFAATAYAGRPVVHMTRDVGTILTTLGAVDRYGDHLETKQGARVASGGGYAPLQEPTDTPATPLPDNADGVQWLYITGAVVARRSAVIEVTPQITTSPIDGRFLALTERLYAVTYECVSAAVPVAANYVVPV